MDLKQALQLLEHAGDDPRSLALVTLDLLLASKPGPLRRVVEAAAVPHWFDAAVLGQLLDEDLRPATDLWYRELVAMPFCEAFPQRKGHNVHESTRLGLRRRLSLQDAERFNALTRRAVAAFAGNTIPERIERAFHRLGADPLQAGPEIRELEYGLRQKVEDGLALAAALDEYLSDGSAPMLVQFWALWTAGTVREPYLTIADRMDLAARALQCAQAADSTYASAAAAVMIAGILLERGRPGDAKMALAHYQRGLEDRERLLAANPDSAQGARDVCVSLNKLADFFASRGQPGDADIALAQYNRGLEISERLLAANPESAQAARDLSVSLTRLADFFASRGQPGDAEIALAQYQRSLEIDERLLIAYPESVHAAQDVAVSLGQLGDFLASRGQPGDAQKALMHYQRCLEIREQLLATNPGSAQAAREASVSLGQLGDFLASRGLPGDAEKALALYQRGLETCERLLAANPESGLAARDVSVSLNRLADFLATRGQPGDAESALSLYQRSLDTSERLFAANQESAQAARDVCVSLNRLGDFLMTRGQPGDTEMALRHYERWLQTSERLFNANPESAVATRDLAVSLGQLGSLLSRRSRPGDAERAFAHYQRSLKLDERLLAANPDSAQAARDVSVSLGQLGEFLANRGQPGDAESALLYYQRSLEIDERLLVANPDSVHTAQDVCVSLEQLGALLASRGQPGDVENARMYYQRGLEIRERLLATNPESVLAARDVRVLRERLAQLVGDA